MRQSEAWIMQAKSDLDAAVAVMKDSDFSTYCQALAKYQQTTEKSVKGMIAALKELGFSRFTFSGGHTLDPEMKHLDVLRRRPDLPSVQEINKIVVGHQSDILQLRRLAPRMPGQDQLFIRNTEYPFNDVSAGNWTAPAAEGIYAVEEVRKAHRTAWRVHHSAAKFTASLDRRR